MRNHTRSNGTSPPSRAAQWAPGMWSLTLMYPIDPHNPDISYSNSDLIPRGRESDKETSKTQYFFAKRFAFPPSNPNPKPLPQKDSENPLAHPTSDGKG